MQPGQPRRDDDPAKLADFRDKLDKIVQARRKAITPTSPQIPEHCQRIAELWMAEAFIWANLASAPDFPHGTDHGVLLDQAARHAADYADTKAQSWLTSGDRHTGTPQREGLDL
jgi:hypothetical protein